MIVSQSFQIKTRGDGHVIEINDEVCRRVAASGIDQGIVTVFVTGTTAGVTIIEHEPGLVDDLNAAMERFAPKSLVYQHHVRNPGEDNGWSHTRAALIGPSLVVPIKDKRPLLGTWQRIILVDFDSRPRTRDVVVQVMGE